MTVQPPKGAKPPVRSLVERLDRRLAALLLEAERELDHGDLMVFADKLAKRKESFWEKHVYPVFRERMEKRSRRG